MKKNIALLFGLVLGLGFVSCSGDDDDDEYTNGGEGKYLAEEVITRYVWTGNHRSSEGEPYQITRYNKDGRIVNIENYYYGSRVDYTYYENGDKKEERFYDRNNTITSTYKYEYNYVDSFVVMYSYNWKDQLVSTIKSEYNNDKKLIRETEIVDSISNDYGKVKTYSYSVNTKTTDITNLKDGLLYRRIIEEVDSHGNFKFVDYGNTVYKYENEYDSEGRILTITEYFSDEEADYNYTGYTYNDDGTVKKKQQIFSRVTTAGPGLVIDYKREVYDFEYTYIYKKK